MSETTSLYDGPLHMMEVQGGSFVRALVACYYSADPPNKVKLRETFADYFIDYKSRFEAHRSALKAHGQPQGGGK